MRTDVKDRMQKPVRMRGQVAKWIDQRGFGFIQRTDGGKDIFFHARAVTNFSGRVTMTPGDWVEFEITQGERGEEAINVQLC